MILVDTSVWIDHLHSTEPRLVECLSSDEVGVHPLVTEELAVGSIKNRHGLIPLLESLRQFAVVTHAEVLELVSSRTLWGRGLGVVDLHLLGSVLITPGSTLWTRDKRLGRAATDLRLPLTT